MGIVKSGSNIQESFSKLCAQWQGHNEFWDESGSSFDLKQYIGFVNKNGFWNLVFLGQPADSVDRCNKR